MDNILTYFNGEKFQCTIGVIVSIIFIVASIFFILQQKAILRGMSFVIIPLSILLLIICFGVIYRTSEDIERVTSYYKNNSENIQIKEIPRMEKVMKSFDIIKKVEIVIFIIGLVLAVLFLKNEIIRGIAIGLVIMGVSLYLFDYFAELRGENYLDFLKSL